MHAAPVKLPARPSSRPSRGTAKAES
jgi:hypothetical protein